MADIHVLYEDNHLLCVVKPPMIPVQADASGDGDFLTALKGYVKVKYNKPGDVYLGLVHRLDRPAGGVMVFARTSKAASRLSDQLRRGLVKKTYLAVVVSPPEQDEGRLADWLLKDRAANMSRVVPEGTPGAKACALTYAVVQRKNGLSLLRVELETGRAHQIRVQFANVGCPLLGDAKYGKGGQPLALWSYSLEFTHPTRGTVMRIECAPTGKPWDMFNL